MGRGFSNVYIHLFLSPLHCMLFLVNHKRAHTIFLFINSQWCRVPLCLCFLLHQLFASVFSPLTAVRAVAQRQFGSVSEHGSVYLWAKGLHVTLIKVRVPLAGFIMLFWLKGNLAGMSVQLTDNLAKCPQMSTQIFPPGEAKLFLYTIFSHISPILCVSNLNRNR